jgi:phosphoribosyl-ATP pyrophosphohydrolase/phosphoribosyl-AMP cyclohydrolase
MSKSRKVKVAGKAGRHRKGRKNHAKPAVHKFRGRPRISKKDKGDPKSHILKFTGKEGEEGPGPDSAPAPPAKGMAARLAAMAAASAEMDDIPEVSPAKKGPVSDPFEGLEDDSAPAPKAVKPHPPESAAPAPAPAALPDEGVQVVAKGPSKFSLADLELLKSAIKVKGTGTVVDGINFEELKWDAEGLIPVIAQDRRTGAVLMLAHTNRDTLEQTLRTRNMTYWSRSRNKVWVKGEESGHAQRLVKLEVDCDKDAILAVVDQEGPACHRDTGTCWNSERTLPVASFLGELDRIIAEYAKSPKPGSHTSKLLAEPLGALRKFVEEANEVTRVLQGKPNPDSLEHEAADVLYHLLVACRTKGVGIDKILTELYARHMAAQVNAGKS